MERYPNTTGYILCIDTHQTKGLSSWQTVQLCALCTIQDRTCVRGVPQHAAAVQDLREKKYPASVWSCKGICQLSNSKLCTGWFRYSFPLLFRSITPLSEVTWHSVAVRSTDKYHSYTIQAFNRVWRVWSPCQCIINTNITHIRCRQPDLQGWLAQSSVLSNRGRVYTNTRHWIGLIRAEQPCSSSRCHISQNFRTDWATLQRYSCSHEWVEHSAKRPKFRSENCLTANENWRNSCMWHRR